MAATVPPPPTIPAATRQIDYADLYARWEQGNWRATEIDFSQDRVDWHERMTDEQRRGALWLYAIFFHGEDSVTDDLGPYVDAAPLEEQKYFLTTQQVDEARHSVFFHRFMREVVGVGGDGSIGSTLAVTEPLRSWGSRQVFARLDRMADELRADRSPVQLARAVTLYHLIVEGSLAQPGQHMIERSLEELDLLPGFREGMRNVALDEQRHIAFGMRLLADLHVADGRTGSTSIQDAIVETIRELLPMTTAVAWPPGGDRSYTRSFGFELEELYEEGARLQEARLRSIGLKPEAIPRFPLPVDKSPRERAERGVTLLEAGFLGEPDVPAKADPAAMDLVFDQMARLADPSAVTPGTVLSWRFVDAPALDRHLRFAADGVVAGRGEAPDASLTLTATLQDFVDLTAGRVDARRLLVRRRLRPRGDLRLLLRMPRIFG